MTTTASCRLGSPIARPRDPRLDERILGAASSLLSEVGYDALTMERIAERADVGKPTVYRRWPTLAHLVFEVQARATLPAELPDTGTLHGDLREVLHVWRDVVTHTDRALIADQFGTMITDEDFAHSVFEGIFQPLNRRAAQLYERARERGEVRDDVDPVGVMRDLGAQLLMRTILLHQPLDDDELEDLLDRMLNGLAVRTPRSAATGPGPAPAGRSTSG